MGVCLWALPDLGDVCPFPKLFGKKERKNGIVKNTPPPPKKKKKTTIC
jgi:hypothetical protein